MKDYLESLEIGESKVKLSKEEIKAILTEHGKDITRETEKATATSNSEIEEYKKTINALEEQINSMPDSSELDNLKKEIEAYKNAEAQRLADEEARKVEDALNTRIESAINGREFINEFTKESIVSRMKNAIKDEANVGKSDTEIFDALVKDQNNIFVNPNQPAEIPSMGEGTVEQTSHEMPTFW